MDPVRKRILDEVRDDKEFFERLEAEERAAQEAERYASQAAPPAVEDVAISGGCALTALALAAGGMLLLALAALL
jgi:hypothetical protein